MKTKQTIVICKSNIIFTYNNMIRRLFHTSLCTFSVKKQGIKLTKMLYPKAKRHWYETNNLHINSMPSLKSLTRTKNEPGKRSIRRLGMLNKMFMKSITDLMSTGTTSMDVVGRGIEISKVSVTPDFHTVNVYWVCKGDSKDEETESLLNKTAGALRHELSTLRVMGEVPYIVFVKDRQEARVVDLDRRLVQADYGEDFEPTELGHLLKTEFTLDTKLSPAMKAKIKQLDEEQPLIEEPIPEMTHSVFGLDHEKIMNRLLAARKRSKDAWINVNEDRAVISYRTPDEKTDDLDVGAQRQELAEFLLKRQILQNKLHKQLQKSEHNWLLDQEDSADEEQAYDDDDYDDQYDDETIDNLETNKRSPFR